MQIEIGAPASLPLALVRFETGAAGLMGAALRYPPVNLSARSAAALTVTGARADHALVCAQRFFQHHQLPAQAEVEIELAIPSQMGLCSEPLLALSVAQALAWVHGRPHTDLPALAAAAGVGPEHGLALQAYAQGGMLLVEAPGPGGAVPRGALPAALRRQPLAHPDDRAWVFVLLLPRPPAGTSETLETDRLSALLGAAPHLVPETGRLFDAVLWPALAADDIDGFGRALGSIQAFNAAALARAGAAVPLTDDEQAVLALCQAQGAVACGRSPTGLALFALIRGAQPSIALRQKLLAHVGVRGGTVLGAIVDNTGARHQVHAAPPINTGVSPLVSARRGDKG